MSFLEPGPLNGIMPGDILIDDSGHPWRYHAPWTGYPAGFLVVALIPHEDEPPQPESILSPKPRSKDHFRRASVLEQIAMASAGFLL